MSPRQRALLGLALLATALAPGCLNPILDNGEAPNGATFIARVALLDTGRGDSFPLDRTDLEDLLVANSGTTDLNGLVKILDDAAGKVDPEHFVRLKEASWNAGLDRFQARCQERAPTCSDHQFHVIWNGATVEVAFERTLG